MTVRMPVLLSSELETIRPLKAVGLSLTASLRDRSQAQMTASRDESPIPMRSFIDVYTQKGFFATFRVTNSALSNERGRVYTLTHAIDTLRDWVYQMQGTFEGTKEEFLLSLFAYQKDVRWQLGYVEDGDAAYKSPNINYTKLSDLFSKYLQDNPDVYPSYDFSTSPWTVNILKLPTEVSARFSITRNADTCNIVYDDKSMCNRLYLAVNTPEKVNGITKYNAELRTYENAASIAQYGIIEKTASVKTDEITDGDADAWANAFLEKYAQPEVNITVDGYELYKQTGEIYDEAAVSKRAIVSLPEYGTTTTQRIESIQYPDVLNAPTAIVVSLATKQKTFTTAISNLEQEVEKVGGVAGGAALSSANAEEVYAWSLIMQKVVEAVDGTGITALWETGIIIDAVTGAKIYSISQGFDTVNKEVMVNRAAIDVNSMQISLAVEQGRNNASAITANAQSITAISKTVDELSNTVSQAQIDINGAKADILLKADKTYVEGIEKTANQAKIDINAANAAISLKAEQSSVNALANRVSSAEIAINGANSRIDLKADETYVDNLFAKSITTENLSASLSNLNAIVNDSIQGNRGDFETIIAQGAQIGASGGLSIGGLNYSAHSHEVSVSDDGTVTLGVVSVTGGNFNIADTKIYKDGVSAAKASVTLSSAGWINGVNTVSASNGKTFPVSLPAFSASAGAFNSEHKAMVYFSTESVQTPLKSIEVDASGVYNAGYAEGWAAAKARFRMDWPDQGSYDYLLNITQPGNTPESADVTDQLQIGAYYTLNEIRNTAANTFFVSGWAYARTRLNGGEWTYRHRVNMTQTTTINVGQ